MLEKQFRNYFKRAEKAKGATGEILLQLLERRIDNVIYRAGFAASRAGARQMVSHKFIKVNGRRVNIASFLVDAGDEITIKGKESQEKAIKEIHKELEDRTTPEWLEVSDANLAVKVETAN